MQKKTIRIVTKFKNNAPPFPLFSELKILPLELLISFSCGQLTHSIYHIYAPKSLHNLWITNDQRENNHDLRNAHQLHILLPVQTM